MASGPHSSVNDTPAAAADGPGHDPGEPHTQARLTVPATGSGPLTKRDTPSADLARAAADTPAAAHTPTAGTRAVLRVVRGETSGVPFALLDGRNYIGRATPDRPVDLDLTGQEAAERVWSSRQHAVVTVDRGTVFVEDLNSLNGTFVNRNRLHPGQPKVLQAGDVVQVGTVQLRLEL